MCIVTVKLPKLGVVAMHHGAGFDIGTGKAHSDAVFENRLALENFSRSDLVARRYLTATGEVFGRHFSANAHFDPGHHHIVVGVQANNRTDQSFFSDFNHGV